MERDEIFSKLQAIVADTFEIDLDQVTEDVSLDDLGADSFDRLELITALEDEFGCVFPNEVYEQMETIADAVEAIASFDE